MDGRFGHHLDPDQPVADVIMQLAGDPHPFFCLRSHLYVRGELEQPCAGLFQLKMLLRSSS